MSDRATPLFPQPAAGRLDALRDAWLTITDSIRNSLSPAGTRWRAVALFLLGAYAASLGLILYVELQPGMQLALVPALAAFLAGVIFYLRERAAAHRRELEERLSALETALARLDDAHLEACDAIRRSLIALSGAAPGGLRNSSSDQVEAALLRLRQAIHEARSIG